MQTNSRTKALLAASVAYCAVVLLATPAAAQQTAPETAAATAPNPDDDAEDGPVIVVTGSSIRGQPPVGSALINVGRADIDASTSATTDQILKEIPQVFNYGVTDGARSQEGGSSNLAYGSSINIRGIGPYATLTLLNGRRPAPQGTVGVAVDPTNIPAIALERVEIIADGASAIYGSDAVSGVANLILRRRYDGFGADAQYGFGKDYNNFTASAIFGTSWDSGRLVIAGQHAYRTALNGTDRDYYRADLTPFGGTDFRVSQCNPGNIVIGTTSYAIPAGGATAANLVPGTVNRCDVTKTTDLLPRQEINSGTLTFDQKIVNGVNLFVDGLFARRNGFRLGPPAAPNLVVPSSNAFFVAPAGAVLPACPASAGAPAGSVCETVQYSYAGVFPNSRTSIFSEVWQLTGGADIDIAKDWALNLYATVGRNHDHVFTIGTVNSANQTRALASSTAATAFNPFGTSANSQTVVNSIFDFPTDTDGRLRYRDYGAKIDGTLFALPGGEVKIAVGGEYNDVRLVTGRVLGPAGAQTGPILHLGRKVKSLYGELLVPIFGADNATSGLRSLTLDIAGRYDKYSDVGSTTNPKIGLNWQPVEDLRLHASYGTSFRAPLLAQLYGPAGNGLGVATYFDPKANGGAGGNIRAVVLTGDNFNLQPETATTYSVGADYSPSWAPGARLSLNYFNIAYHGIISSQVINLNVLRQEALYSTLVYRGAAATAQITQRINAGLPISGGTTAEALISPVFIDGRNNNLGDTSTDGLDFGLVYPWTIDSLGKFRLTANGTVFFKYRVATSPGAPIANQLNNYAFPLKFRSRASLGWSNGPFDATVFVNYQNAYNNTLVTPAAKIHSNTTVDLALSFDLGTAFGIAKSVRVGLDATNLFDRDPPFANIAPSSTGGGGYDAYNASAVGRVIAVSLRTSF